MSERSEWLRRSRETARRAWRSRAAPADRMAQLRTLIRLEGGRLDLSGEGAALSPEEAALLPRFGLQAVGEGAVLRLEDHDIEARFAGLEAALQLDPDERTHFQSASPDGPLLRFSTHAHYRSVTQKAAVHALATMPPAAALMVSMPTGSGKSLLFQIAPLLWAQSEPGACVVVITPTIALADDHERTLRQLPGLEGSRALSGSMTSSERSAVLDAFRRGETPVLLISPEAAFGSAREALLEAARAADQKHGLAARLAGVFVDEAHIIESWGRTFRPDFQRLPALIDALRAGNPQLRTVLLSATLTDAAREVLRLSYGRGPWLEIHAGVPRYDFDLVVESFDDRAARDSVLLDVIDRAPRPAVVYTTLVSHAEDLHQTLVRRGYERVAAFTGNVTDAEARRSIVQAWADNDLDLVVATSAFGLGVDKPNVRSVIHACLPESPARYYQEIGRASRDGHQGLGVCLWTRWRPGVSDSDEEVAGDLGSNAWLSRDIAEARWAALLKDAKSAWQGGQRRLQLRLNAARAGLGRWTGEPNRRWNMSLINLMQRAGALVIEHVADPDGADPLWDVTLVDDSLLGEGDEFTAAWDRIFAVRDEERRTAQSEFTAFKALMRGRRSDCLLTGLFELIEPETWEPPPCGRCPSCRERGIAPPKLLPKPSRGQVWPKAAASANLTPGVLLLAPDDPRLETGLTDLLEILVRGGVGLIVAPDDIAGDVGAAVSRITGPLGLVLALSEWLEDPEAAADVPTALLAAATGVGDVLRPLEQISARRPHQVFILVADPATRIGGRPLAQIASRLAPYDQAAFAAMTADPPSELQDAT